ncbi:MAG: GNAT family N-acetyltransferase [Clostridia bacterium]|nr:GNAT family N-acetyltransferase [Clostridia bacterium]
MIRFIPAAESGAALHALLTSYYREGEDADTPQEELDGFISYLQELLDKRILWGDVVFDGDTAMGFVLFAVDGDSYPFSECPGMGTIAEIFVNSAYRQQGLGRLLVRCAEDALRAFVTQMYVCAHASAQSFWQRCGYRPNGAFASNNLPICIKSI